MADLGPNALLGRYAVGEGSAAIDVVARLHEWKFSRVVSLVYEWW